MSNYTHCRGCGRELASDYQNPERDDGLCLHSATPGVLDCTEQFGRWWEATNRGERNTFYARHQPEGWKHPLWTVKVDEWLAATR